MKNFCGPPREQVLWALAKQTLAVQWPTLMQLVGLATQMGMEVYLVGGQVRDLLLLEAQSQRVDPYPHLHPHPQLRCPDLTRDVDLVVEGDAPALARRAVAQLGGALTLSNNPFLTARWHCAEGLGIDLASARSEHYAAPAALPQVEPAKLMQDLFRRDFTVNAMALGLTGQTAGQLYDPYGGFGDLKAGCLRVLHDLSFHDDPTRMFRAVRFAVRFDLDLAADTLRWLRAALKAEILPRLSQARLGGELDLILAEPHVVQAFALMRRWGILAALDLPLCNAHTLGKHLAAGRRAHHQFADIVPRLPAQSEVLWLVLAQHLELAQRQAYSGCIRQGGAALQRWLGGPQRIQAALAALHGSHVAQRNDTLAKLDVVERICLFAQVKAPERQRTVIWWEREGQYMRSALTGQTLLQLGYAPGPQIKLALAAALHAAQAGADAAEQQAAAKAVLEGAHLRDAAPR